MNRTKEHQQDDKSGIIGAAYRKPKQLTRQYARDNKPVLFLGETGSGKEMFAKLYMKSSERKGNKRSISCAAVPSALLRSEIFGHVKGAFSGAINDRKGFVETCNGGILFLDELQDASMDFQAAILRVVENNSYTRLGADIEVTNIETLIIAAASNLCQIREDLKHRFHIVPIPTLQKFDIPFLARKFMERDLKPEEIETLMKRDYPGNVRQLKRDCENMPLRRDKVKKNRKKISEKLNLKEYERQGKLFDYKRFAHEYLSWHRYFYPYIRDTGCPYRYEYMPDDKSTFNYAVGRAELVRQLQPHEEPKSLPGELWNDVILEAIYKRDNEKIDKIIQWFIASRNLPKMMKELERVPFSLFDSVDQSVSSVQQEPLINITLAELLDMQIDWSLNTFWQYYYAYAEEKYGSLKAAALARGDKPKRYQQRKRRRADNEASNA